jgi:hypothetical protein
VNISRKASDHFLAKKLTARRMEAVLVDWANSQTTVDDFLRGDVGDALMGLIRKYPEFFGSMPKHPTTYFLAVNTVQRFLRMAWDATDLRRREWFIFKARYYYHQHNVSIPPGFSIAEEVSREEKARILHESRAAEQAPPPLTPFEQVAYHFHRIADRARRCGNPECPAPYFFARKKGQKYCSATCAGPAQRAQKLRWWRQNRGKGESE